MNEMAKLNIDKDSVRIEGVIDFSTVVELRDAGTQWLKNSAPAQCQIDFSGVTELNSAATALLLDWLRLAKELKKELAITQVPQRLRDLMQLAELEDVLASEMV